MLISLMAFDLMAGCYHRHSRFVYIGLRNRLSDCMRRAAQRALLANTSSLGDASCAITTVQIFISLFKKRPAFKTEKCPCQYSRHSRPRRFILKRFSAHCKQFALFTRHYSICVLFQFCRRKCECFQVT